MSLITPFLSEFTMYINVLAVGAIITKYQTGPNWQTRQLLKYRRLFLIVLKTQSLSSDSRPGWVLKEVLCQVAECCWLAGFLAFWPPLPRALIPHSCRLHQWKLTKRPPKNPVSKYHHIKIRISDINLGANKH